MADGVLEEDDRSDLDVVLAALVANQVRLMVRLFHVHGTKRPSQLLASHRALTVLARAEPGLEALVARCDAFPAWVTEVATYIGPPHEQALLDALARPDEGTPPLVDVLPLNSRRQDLLHAHGVGELSGLANATAEELVAVTGVSEHLAKAMLVAARSYQDANR